MNRLHHAPLYKSGLERSPSDRNIISDFIANRFDGSIAKKLVRSLMKSVNKGLEFEIPSISFCY